jgi:hypothetical protein
MRRFLKSKVAVITAALGLLLAPAMAYAANTPNLTQTVNAGTLSTDILQSDDSTPVASPTVAFSTLNRTFTCQTSTGTLGDANDKVNVTNFGSNNGFVLSIAATGGYTSTWTAGANTYKFNDSTGSTAGCTNGQLTVDPSVATLTDDCQGACNDTGVTQGASTAFDHTGSVDSVTLLSSTSGSAWEGYLTGIGLSQKVPASQPSGSYALGMTITVAAQ